MAAVRGSFDVQTPLPYPPEPRKDLESRVGLLMDNIDHLTQLVDSRIDVTVEQMTARYRDYLMTSSRHPALARLADVLFRRGCLVFSLCHQLLQMAVLTVLGVCKASEDSLRVAYIILLLLDVLHLILLTMVTVELVQRMIRRVAKLLYIIQLHFTLVLLYAGIFTLIELLLPGSFNGINSADYTGYFRNLHLYLDFLYFSDMASASIGFGDITPRILLTRFVVVSQSVFSVVFLSILMSNWIS